MLHQPPDLTGFRTTVRRYDIITVNTAPSQPGLFSPLLLNQIWATASFSSNGRDFFGRKAAGAWS